MARLIARPDFLRLRLTRCRLILKLLDPLRPCGELRPHLCNGRTLVCLWLGRGITSGRAGATRVHPRAGPIEWGGEIAFDTAGAAHEVAELLLRVEKCF